MDHIILKIEINVKYCQVFFEITKSIFLVYLYVTFTVFTAEKNEI